MNHELMRHSCSHLLAAAVQTMFPTTKFAIGPAIDTGFYYDFDLPEKITEADLNKIEAKMAELKTQNLAFTRLELPIDSAIAKVKEQNQEYKVELLEDLKKKGESKVSFYQTGDFLDLCRGPHVANTGEIGAFKLTAIAGAYWRGDEHNQMLTRIYGTCFATQEELDHHLKMQEELKLKDHRKLGKDLDLFSINDDTGPGLILWHPKLSVVREEIELFWRREHRRHGYEYVYTPHIGQAVLWETSGHLDFYKASMYSPMTIDKVDYYLKPMNCPFHIKIYKNRPRSYRELPLRWAELGTVYRYEESGVLHGMFRVRGFTQDDAHIICREDQFVEEIKKAFDFALEINGVFGFKDFKIYLAARDPKNLEKYAGEKRVWDLAEETLKKVLEEKGQKYVFEEGGAKFYGPAIDVKVVDAFGREWQGTTIQLDFNLPQKFAMTYIDQTGKEVQPIMIHRTLLGSLERFVGTLIEVYGGAFPVWLAPVQARLIPIAERHVEVAAKIQKMLMAKDLRVDLDQRNEKMQAKIRDAQLEKIPWMLVVGDKEAADETNLQASVRLRTGQDLGMLPVEEIKQRLTEKVAQRSLEV
ncbi:MAG: threonine--tRNA ligase [bacterium]|nr:threonine--tRNA ligase [bacterium]